jgi:hypothetical protein
MIFLLPLILLRELKIISPLFSLFSSYFQGLDCKFLQGDVTDQKKISNFMKDLFTSGGYSDLKILNYHKDNSLLQNHVHCFPVMDNCGPDFSSRISHIAAVLVQSEGKPNQTLTLNPNFNHKP